MASSSTGKKSRAFGSESVGSSSYLNRHNTQMFTDGKSFSGNERDKLFLNRGDGTFVDVSDLSGCDSPNDGRAVLANDFDDDGDVDLFVHQLQRERHALYRNDAGDGAKYIKVRLVGTSGHWEAVGATITARSGGSAVAQCASRGAGYSSCAAPEWIFGLGDSAEAELEVLWPGGSRESFGNVAAGSRVVLEEGTGKPRGFEARTVEFDDPGPVGLRIEVGETLEAFRAIDETGEEQSLSPKQFAGGERVYLNFWASWCASCVAELPALEEINSRDGVRVIGISIEGTKDHEHALAMFGERANYSTYFMIDDDDDGGLAAVVDLDRLPIPSTLILSADGTLERVITGPVE